MKDKREKGQIVIILALALVAIVGITAVAVDGSMTYNERREDQSIADLALAGRVTQLISQGQDHVGRSAGNHWGHWRPMPRWMVLYFGSILIMMIVVAQ